MGQRGSTGQTRALGYVRVSTQEQGAAGLGATAQHDAVRAEAARRGWTLTILEDVASGRDLNRPGIAGALERLRDAKADVLVVAKLDRLSRSAADFAGLMDTARKEGWAFVALDLGVDTTTPSGRLLAGVMAQVAQWERDVIGQRTSEALQAKKAGGARLGRPVLVPPAIRRRILRERKSGATLEAIADALNAEGIPTAQGGRQWWPATVRKIELRAS